MYSQMATMAKSNQFIHIISVISHHSRRFGIFPREGFVGMMNIKLTHPFNPSIAAILASLLISKPDQLPHPVSGASKHSSYLRDVDNFFRIHKLTC